MKLKGDLVDRFRQALGGKTPTPKRIEKLLEEVETLRVKSGPGETVTMTDAAGKARVSSDQGITWTASTVPDVGSGVVSVEAGASAASFLPPLADEAPEPEPADPSEDPAVRAIRLAAEKREAMLMEQMKNMEARITELAKARLPEEKEAAVGSGKLPVGVKEAGPLGYSGPASFPRGKWFLSPFGPKIEMILCDCPDCVPHRMQHYYCVMCRRGPFDYQQKTPGGRKTWMAPGSTWGISHETCTATCFQRYMEEVQVVLSQRGMEGASGKIPPKPALVPGSD